METVAAVLTVMAVVWRRVRSALVLHGGMPSYRSLGASTLNLPLARDETLSRSQHTNPIGVR